ncbi:MAG: hypothetical protein MO846_03355 [Candidatus Devosia symbiotica]|nr:hypothetical protein [Candidatus Devosia symbiotica]
MPHQLTHEETFVCTKGHSAAQISEHTHEVEKGDTLIVLTNTDLSLTNASTQDFCAIVVFSVGGQAVLSGQPAFTPPWAE